MNEHNIPVDDIGLPQNLDYLNEVFSFYSEGSRDEVYPLCFSDMQYPIYMRRNSSDIKNFMQIFVYQEYAPIFPRMRLNNIVDLGAYIGLSALYFKHKSPNSTIICVEPSLENYAMLTMNLSPYANAHLINSAVWVNNNKLGYSLYMFDGDWGNRVDEISDGAIEAITINEIVEKYKLSSIDLLKIDIEASERRVLSENTEWVSITNCVACETHDRYIDGCSEAFNRLLAPEFNVSVSSETSIAVRK